MVRVRKTTTCCSTFPAVGNLLHVPLSQAVSAVSTGCKCSFHGLQVQFPQLSRSRHKKRYISFVLLSTFRNIATKVANLLRLGKAQIHLAFHSTFRNIATKAANLLRLGKAQIHLAFHSTFRNFASKKGKWIVGVYYIM